MKKADNEIVKELREIKRLLSVKKQVLNLDEFCAYTGFSKAYVYHLTSTGMIKYYKPIGRMIFFDLDEMIEFLKTNPSDDIKGIHKKANKFLFD